MHWTLMILGTLLLAACTAAPRPGPEDTPAAAGASVTVTPTEGAPGSPVTLRASGVPPRTRLAIGAGPPRSEYQIFATATSDRDGNLVTTVQVPLWAERGRPLIFAVSVPDTPWDVLSRPFAVQ
jgi:hypothetical protein